MCVCVSLCMCVCMCVRVLKFMWFSSVSRARQGQTKTLTHTHPHPHLQPHTPGGFFVTVPRRCVRYQPSANMCRTKDGLKKSSVLLRHGYGTSAIRNIGNGFKKTRDQKRAHAVHQRERRIQKKKKRPTSERDAIVTNAGAGLRRQRSFPRDTKPGR